MQIVEQAKQITLFLIEKESKAHLLFGSFECLIQKQI